MEENEELEEVTTTDYSEVLTEINDNLITINSNISTTYDKIEDLETEIQAQNTLLNNVYNGIHFTSNLLFVCFIFFLIIVSARYIKKLL